MIQRNYLSLMLLLGIAVGLQGSAQVVETSVDVAFAEPLFRADDAQDVDLVCPVGDDDDVDLAEDDLDLGAEKAPAEVPLPAVYQDIKKKMDDLYVGVTGFGIPECESQLIIDSKGAPTYGEILFDALLKILIDLDLNNQDVFYDFGSGVGKVVIETYLATPVKKAVGIELSKSRCKSASTIAKAIKKDVKKGLYFDLQERLDEEFWACKNPHKRVNFKKKKLEFREQNFMKEQCKDATVIYMCSTCYSEELMKDLADRFSQLTDGLRVVTLKRLPEHPSFTLIKTYSLPMTWSQTTPVYVYELSNPKNPKKQIKKVSVSCCSSSCKTSSCKK